MKSLASALSLLAFSPAIRAFLTHPNRLERGAQVRNYMVSSPTIPETTPLPTHTFAGMVEQGLLEKFGGPEDIQRILTSWRLLELGYEHNEYVGPSTASPDESMCHQHCHSYVPGLSIQEYWDIEEEAKLSPWTTKLQQKYKEIKKEFTRVAIQDSESLEQQGNNIWAGALTEDASSYGVDWKTLVLCDRGVWDPVSAVSMCWRRLF